MATPIIEGADKIIERAITSLKENSQITRFTPGAKARTLLAIVATEIEKLEETLSSNIVLSLLSGAGGIYLDFLGELVGVQRSVRSAASVSAADQSLRILPPDGLTFGDLNNGQAIIIPPGTLISSADGTVRFNTLLRASLLAPDNEFFIAARALKVGPTGNVPKGVLTELGFTGYSKYPVQKLRVENLSSIQSGNVTESDAFYRYRISNALLSAETGNLSAIRLAALTVQSVADVLPLPLYRGIGTADLLLDTVSGDVSPQTIESVTRAISRVQSLGTDILVRAPRLVGIELAVDVKYAKGLNSSDRSQVNGFIRQALINFYKNVPLGGELFINSLSSIILQSDKRILDIGQPNKPLSEVILWRDSALTGGRRPSVVKEGNVSLMVDERLTLEGSQAEAIRITAI